MDPFVRCIEWQFQRNIQQQLFASELRIKVQRMKECFPVVSLPLPTAEVAAAWNDLPNETTDVLPMSMKTGLVFLQAPPPTPTELSFETDDPSLNGSRDDGWLADVTDSPTPDVMAFRALQGSLASEDDSMSRCSHPDRSLNGQINEDSFQCTSSSSPSSGHGSLSSGSRASPTPMGFHDMVNQWLLDYRAKGLERFVESLIEFGVASPGTVPLASSIARAVVQKVAKVSYMEGKELEITIRHTSLAAFKSNWNSNETWMEVSSTQANTVSPTSHGTNIASFIGSLFDARICNAKDIHVCLSLLSGGEKCIDRVCAMHALMVQANDKLCKNRNLPALMQFRDEITLRDKETGEYLWATTPRSKPIIADIVATIERWLVSQALRRDQSRVSAGNRAIRQKAVGPRLRPVVPLRLGV
ncbi:hypothetical protein J3R82DRAFT_8096 [Butyriboletus roseoflavus]|nr:hypothetical protein J3R82DRAFT_8096 [Butyriboletus roseoflavus]